MKSNKAIKKFAIALPVGIGLILAGFAGLQYFLSDQPTAAEPKNQKSKEITKGIVLGISDPLDELVTRGVKNSAALTQTFAKAPVAGIIPHDIYMGDYIAHFFYELSKVSTPKTIILVGPDHFEKGTQNFTTSNSFWETMFGIVEPDVTIIDALQQKNIAMDETSVLESEHSITALVPFIKHYFPDAKLVPIIVKAKTSQSEITALRETLEHVAPNAVVVGAIDFSHYLLPAESDVNDVSTSSALQQLDQAYFFSLKKNFNDFTDSPASVAFVMDWATFRGATTGDIIYHMNSSDKTGLRNKPSTSYFEAVFY